MTYITEFQEIIMEKEPAEIVDTPVKEVNLNSEEEYKIITKDLDVFYGDFQALKNINMNVPQKNK